MTIHSTFGKLAVSLALAGAFLLPGLDARAADDTLNFVNYRDVRDLNPHLYAGEMYAQEMLFETLVDITADGYKPCLAESWDISADGKVYNVGICQLVQHEALDAATQGFKDALVEKLGEGNVKFDEQNASGDSANCATIVNGFVSSNVDLILANATAPLQAAAQATADIPVLGTSVTDYATALDISDWTGTVGGNISGTSDLAPLDQQAAMIQELFPDAKTVGLLYSNSEANSATPIAEAKAYLEAKGISYVEKTGNTNDEIMTAASSLVGQVDAVFTPTDNVVMAAAAAVSETLTKGGIPFYTGADSFVTAGAFATCGVNYTELGTYTADMALEVLETGTVPEYHVMDGGIITVNTDTAAMIGKQAEYSCFDSMGTVVEVSTTKD